MIESPGVYIIVSLTGIPGIPLMWHEAEGNCNQAGARFSGYEVLILKQLE